MAVPVQTILPFTVASSSNNNSWDQNPHVLALANGQFDIAYVTPISVLNSDVSIQRFNSDGSSSGTAARPLGPADNLEYDPSLVSLGGLQAVVFMDDFNASTQNAVRIGLYGASTVAGGAVITQILTVDDSATLKTDPEVVQLGNGALAVVWVDLTTQQVRGRLVDPATGVLGSSSFLISTTPTTQNGASIYDLGLVALSNGNFAVTWKSSDARTHLRVIDANGVPVSADVTLDFGTTTAVVELVNGRLAMFYWGPGDGITMHTFANDATDASGPLEVFPLSGGFPSAVTLLDGRIFVVCIDDTLGNIIGRVMNPDGTPNTPVFNIAAGVNALNARPDVALLADGRVVVTYTNAATDDIEATVFDPRETGVSIHGTSAHDWYFGSAFADHFMLGGGNDRVDGGDGADFIEGGAGHDTLFGDGGADTFRAETGNDFHNGGAGIDFFDASFATTQVIVDLAGGVVVSALYGSDTIALVENATTGSGNDIFAGNALVNVLDGGAGIDTISYYQVSGNVILDLAAQVGVDGTSTDTLRNFENANGGHGNDSLSGGQGIANVLNGLDNGAAGDTISYYLDNVSVAINLGTNSSLQNGVTDTLLNFENANGSRVGDTIIGNGSANVLNGLGGADTLTGNGGNDMFVFARLQAGGDAITDFVGNGAGVGDTIRFTGYGTSAQGSTFTFVSGNTWQIHSGLFNTNELITINGGAGAVHATDFVFV